VRQPLGVLYAVTPKGVSLEGGLLELLKDELNVKKVDFMASAEGLVTLVAKPNYRTLGPRFQKRTEAVASAVRELPPQALEVFRREGRVTATVEGEEVFLGEEELEVVEEARGDLVVQSEGAFTVALDPTLDQGLKREGLARELVNRIQRLRRDSGLEITDRIRLGISGPEEVQEAVREHGEFIAGETLALELAVGEASASPGPEGFRVTKDVEMDGVPARIALERANP
jgi:isoleucyl-tRNA synthetase